MKHWIEKFIEYSKIERNLSFNTVRLYSITFRLFFQFLKTDDIKLEEISRETIRSFLYYGKNERNWSVKTYIMNLTNFKVFYSFLHDEGVIQDNFIKTLKTPKLPKVITNPLTLDEVQTALHLSYSQPSHSFVKIRNYTLTLFGLHTGLRNSEIRSLYISDVDFDSRIIKVSQGKGAKDREVVITDDMYSSLLRYLSFREKISSPSPVLFCSHLGHKLADAQLYLIYKAISSKLGRKITPHDLRRTYATTLSRKGVPPFIIQNQMGHTDIRTTMGYVTHSIDDAKKSICSLDLY